MSCSEKAAHNETDANQRDLLDKYWEKKIHDARNFNVEEARAQFRKDYETKSKDLTLRHSATPISACTDRLQDLKKIRIQDLVLNQPAKGEYLLLRSLELPISQELYVKLLMEDHVGTGVSVVLTNYIDNHLDLPAEDFIPVGSVYILKQPLLNVNLSGIGIRCDSPSDFIRVDRNHSMYKTVFNIPWKNKIDAKYVRTPTCSNADEWKAEGNSLFVQKKYQDALEAYLVALNMTKDSVLTSVLQLNILAACLVLRRFEECILYADYVLASGNENVKALYRVGKAHYSLKQFNQALEMFQRFLKLEPMNKVVLAEKKRTQERLQEQKGEIDVYKLYLRNSMVPRTPTEFGDYIGPIVVSEVEGKGRGMVATQDIKAGTFLLISKAFQASLETGAIRVSKFFENQVREEKMLANTCQSVLKNPNTFGKMLYSLWTNDSKLDQNFKVFCDEINKTEVIVDADRLSKILTQNSFSLGGQNKQPCHKPSDENITSSGLFVLASYFNHACTSNAKWYCFTDVLAIRSKMFIRKGDEVTISYHEYQTNYFARVHNNAKRGFRCQCDLCLLDQNESYSLHTERCVLYEKHIALKEEYAMLDKPRDSIYRQKLEAIVRGLETSYRKRSSLKVHLFQPYVRLAECLEVQRSNELVELVDKALHSYGVSCDHLMRWALKDEDLPHGAHICPYWIQQAVGFLVGRLSAAANPALVFNWAKVLVKIELVFHGSNWETMFDRFKKYPSVHNLVMSVIIDDRGPLASMFSPEDRRNCMAKLALHLQI